MPSGWPYFAWIDPGETTFSPGHLRWDEQVFSFNLSQEEGDPASLTVVVRRPRNEAGDPIGLLGPGRKIWCWFAFDCGPDLMRFRGRLVGIPTSIFEELVTLEFVAKPVDMVAQKEAVAATLRVLPYYDEAVIDPARRNDPDVVLEGYTKIWHYDRETHVVSATDEITGDDGVVTFQCSNGDVLYEGLRLTLSSGPLAQVDLNAEFTWTQSGYGIVDLTRYLLSHWPNVVNGQISSYTMSASDWPKQGASIGDGWIAVSASAHDIFDFSKTHSITKAFQYVVKNTDGEDAGGASWSQTRSGPAVNTSFLPAGNNKVSDDKNVTYAVDGDGRLYASSLSRNTSYSGSSFAMQAFKPTLVAGWKAERQCTERVSFSLIADVQPILTDPEDGEALRIDDIRSINLSDPEQGILIGDARRRSYIATERGNRSIEHLIALARAHLMKRARVVEITFATKLARMPEVSLRKSAVLDEPRIGQALGKIIGYSLALDGKDGQVNCEVRIGCTIGNGGTVTAVAGDPTYCTVDYAGADYQVFTNTTYLLPAIDSSVGYSPPIAAPNDDGLELTGALRAEDVIETPLTVVFGPIDQEDSLSEQLAPWQQFGVQLETDAEWQDMLDSQNTALKNMLRQLETRATFKLKSMSRNFTTDYEIAVTDLKIPTGYDLEAE